ARDLQYRVTFRTGWGTRGSEAAVNFPTPATGSVEKPHTGGMLLVVHDELYNPFQITGYATKGLSESAAFGANDVLVSEVQETSPDYRYRTAPPMATPGERTFTITANPTYHLLS